MNVTTVSQYLASLPEDRRATICAVRKAICENLPQGYEEGILYGMIAYYVPLSRYPNTKDGKPMMIAALASQKNYYSLYLMCAYGDEETARWFKSEYAKTGKKLNMGKSCVRFVRLEDLPLELIGRAIARVTPEKYIARVEALVTPDRRRRARRG